MHEDKTFVALNARSIVSCHRELLRGADGHAMEVASLLADNQAEVSGVIGSAASAGNIRGPLGDDFALMPHAAAKFPYPAGFIRRGIELKLTQSAEASRWDVETVDHGAVEAQGPNTTRVQFKGEAHEVVWGGIRARTIRAGRWTWHYATDQPRNRRGGTSACCREGDAGLLRCRVQ